MFAMRLLAVFTGRLLHWLPTRLAWYLLLGLAFKVTMCCLTALVIWCQVGFVGRPLVVLAAWSMVRLLYCLVWWILVWIVWWFVIGISEGVWLGFTYICVAWSGLLGCLCQISLSYFWMCLQTAFCKVACLVFSRACWKVSIWAS